MKLQLNHSPALLVASTLAVIGLVIFQLKWMAHSRQLSDEIFNQRVCMALCSTVEDFGGGALCSRSDCSATCQHEESPDSSFAVSENLAKDSTFQANLRKSLNFYQIPLDYRLSLADSSLAQNPYQCAVALPAGTSTTASYINLDFPEKKTFSLGNMNFMVAATVLILLFTAVVLLFANWSLLKQKRLLQTNVDFFNNMAHEFRTPLTNVGLAANLLSKKHKDLKGDHLVEIIRQENTRLLDQVERVLHLARLENGDYLLQKEKVPLRPLLESIRDEMALQIEERQAVVKLNDVPQHLEVYGDRLHLGNVFRNLLDNALKYTGGQPEISISAREQTEGIQIEVQDNGIGIPASQSRLIFKKFQRAMQGDRHDQKGFGLGLAYVKRMVEMHNGSVRVSSEVNRGSCFEVCLPASC